MLKNWKFEPRSHRPIWKAESRLESPKRKGGGGGGWGAVISSGSLLSFVSKGGPLKNWRQQAQYDLYKRPVTLVKLKTKDKNQISLVAESRIDFVMQQLFCWLYYLWFSAISGFLTCSWTTIGAL